MDTDIPMSPPTSPHDKTAKPTKKEDGIRSPSHRPAFRTRSSVSGSEPSNAHTANCGRKVLSPSGVYILKNAVPPPRRQGSISRSGRKRSSNTNSRSLSMRSPKLWTTQEEDEHESAFFKASNAYPDLDELKEVEEQAYNQTWHGQLLGSQLTGTSYMQGENKNLDPSTQTSINCATSFIDGSLHSPKSIQSFPNDGAHQFSDGASHVQDGARILPESASLVSEEGIRCPDAPLKHPRMQELCSTEVKIPSYALTRPDSLGFEPSKSPYSTSVSSRSGSQNSFTFPDSFHHKFETHVFPYQEQSCNKRTPLKQTVHHTQEGFDASQKIKESENISMSTSEQNTNPTANVTNSQNLVKNDSGTDCNEKSMCQNPPTQSFEKTLGNLKRTLNPIDLEPSIQNSAAKNISYRNVPERCVEATRLSGSERSQSHVNRELSVPSRALSDSSQAAQTALDIDSIQNVLSEDRPVLDSVDGRDLDEVQSILELGQTVYNIGLNNDAATLPLPFCHSSEASNDVDKLASSPRPSAETSNESNLTSSISQPNDISTSVNAMDVEHSGVNSTPFMTNGNENSIQTAKSHTEMFGKGLAFKFAHPLPALDMSLVEKNKPTSFVRQLSKRKNEMDAPDLLQNIPKEDKRQLHDDDDSDDTDDDFHSIGNNSCPCSPTSPKTRKIEAKRKANYDPYQYFEVQHKPCLILTVRVICGRNIKVGAFRDYFDVPDPYINLIMRSSPDGRKSTTVKTDDRNPVWNETFTFFINFTQANVLEITLMESNYYADDLVGTVYFDIVDIDQMDVPQLETFVFNGVSEIDIEFKLEFDRHPTLRYSLCLSDAEKEFLEKRKRKAMIGMRQLLGEEEGPTNMDEVPTIAVLGSGGGFRAMTGYCGVFKALVESGVLDCTAFACGLSGSSWLLSTLYSHPKWPNLDMAEFADEMKHNIDKSLLRFLTPWNMYSYASYLVTKRKEGQPVSFTDIFGRMVGETLLKGRTDVTLTDQREKIKDGDVPLPLYTCVHVKKDVPARSFQEWVEFSPYEIGMPKYGTFMDSELFGSKFFMGKLVKKFKEQPLHFLQGIWGSAFCILFKRLLDDNRRIDPAEMMRREMGEEQMLREEAVQVLEHQQQESSSDLSDEEIDISNSSSGSVDSDSGYLKDDREGPLQRGSSFDSNSSIDSQSSDGPPRERKSSVKMVDLHGNQKDDAADGAVKLSNQATSSEAQKTETSEGFPLASADSLEEDNEYDNDDDEEDDDTNMDDDNENDEEFNRFPNRKSSLVTSSAKKNKGKQLSSSGDLNDENQKESNVSPPGMKADEVDNSQQRKSVNWGSCPASSIDTKMRRDAFKRTRSSLRKSRTGSKSYWKEYLKGILESNWELVSTRRGRAAVIHNFMRGLSLQQTYPLSPFTPVEERVKEGDEFDGIFELHPTSVKHIYMVDAGLTFNSPYPLILRPQREVDIILSFDFSARPSDNHHPFKELLLAAKWAHLNRIPFPPIDPAVMDTEKPKELYIFRHPSNPDCPIVLHFVLINNKFKYYKKPGVPRQTKEEFDFAEFDIFDNPKAPFSTFNFTYQHENFEKLSQLMEFNTLLHIEDIKKVIKDVIMRKRFGPARVPVQSNDIKLLRMKSVQEYKRLRKFITRLESRNSMRLGSTPSTPSYMTPNPGTSPSRNPFFAGMNRDSLNESIDSSSSFKTPRDKLTPSFLFNESVDERGRHHHEKRQGRDSASSTSSAEHVFGTPPQNPLPFTCYHRNPPMAAKPSQHMVQPTHKDGRVSDKNVPKDAPFSDSRPRQSGSGVNQTDIDVVDNVFDESDSGRSGPQGIITDCTDSSLSKITSATSSGNGSPSLSVTPSAFFTTPHELSSPTTKTPSPKLMIPSVAHQFGSGSFPSSTPTASGGFANSSASSGVLLPTTGKIKKDPPPNPFFVNAHFMRSGYGSSSSSSSGSSLGFSDHADSGNLRKPTNLSYRLKSANSRPGADTGSPNQFLQSSNSIRPQANPMPQSPLVSKSISSKPQHTYESSRTEDIRRHKSLTPIASQSSSEFSSENQANDTSSELLSQEEEEHFVEAPEAFTSDGTPVTDPTLAKMYYDGAKSKRRFFRRQSTVSSMSGISLDERPADAKQKCDGAVESFEGEDSQSHLAPTPSPRVDYSYRDYFYSCDDSTPGSTPDSEKEKNKIYPEQIEFSDLAAFEATATSTE